MAPTTIKPIFVKDTSILPLNQRLPVKPASQSETHLLRTFAEQDISLCFRQTYCFSFWHAPYTLTSFHSFLSSFPFLYSHVAHFLYQFHINVVCKTMYKHVVRVVLSNSFLTQTRKSYITSG